MTAASPTRKIRLGKARTTPAHPDATAVSAEEDEKEVLIRQLRRVTERNLQQFDLGFQAAVTMVEAGADLERLKEASGVAGPIATEWGDTEPVDLFESVPTDVNFTPPAFDREHVASDYDYETVVVDPEEP